MNNPILKEMLDEIAWLLDKLDLSKEVKLQKADLNGIRRCAKDIKSQFKEIGCRMDAMGKYHYQRELSGTLGYLADIYSTNLSYDKSFGEAKKALLTALFEELLEATKNISGDPREFIARGSIDEFTTNED